ncbi:D-serine ammonia-lyase [Comamonas terrigena]|uniref:D-serine ammonia-lyase n=1 Tax=Comamonas terrigena TaxID=32013 RepID=UPI00244ACD90|nr:D-serine ammonia-lyase [Comamonas terrigena]MDH0047986.1 D-serine ammonia-lyase [Comamonas terrigena]MDH0510414.1 D-serine ammonia-lyase [Comamonas terrigena]MDH1090016.1 D-serine ammonia-lyase [Comamonas terrigena]MDH1290213.1 D-serine ammonia-lyase [Comamonas terrigena]MDH1499888.1 D-serine ammonia-lyase [Comamonas terrigena]
MSQDDKEVFSQVSTLWINAECVPEPPASKTYDIIISDVEKAEQRLARFAPLLATLFPELAQSGGIVESPLCALPPAVIGAGPSLPGSFWVKADHQLAVAGSVKARGGFHEVLEFAEQVARDNGLLVGEHGYQTMGSPAAREVFSHYEVAVGSTGNLGMSIGIMSAALGFRATVHMSAEAKDWKKRKLRSHGVTVHEYEGDYGQAVAKGRELAKANPMCHFVDDEHSLSLFSGYAVAALRLSAQFAAQGIAVDEEHPLFVYIPCGVGGAPGGVCYGLKHVFGAAVHCFFVEPEDSACFLVQMQNPDKPGISIYDAGQHNRTIADGLAVPRASELVYPLMRERLAGVVITSDECMHADVWRMQSLARFKVEPSAAAAVSGPRALLQSEAGRRYIAEQGLQARMLRANHIVWTTGGALMPGDEYEALLLEGERASDGLFGALADTGGN